MNAKGHTATTLTAFRILKELEGNLPFVHFEMAEMVAMANVQTDQLKDVSFVDVEFLLNDQPHYSEEGFQFTAFDHFIDIRKGRGQFDDFDGYSYARGSGHIAQFQSAKDAWKNAEEWKQFFAQLSGKKVDAGVAWYFNDEYIDTDSKHSPAVARYSYPQDCGKYATAVEECKVRFPRVGSTGAAGKGFPYSIFMPLDNLARYWYTQFVQTHDPAALGYVLHAIQDASIPHHAASCLGNWHEQYEAQLGKTIGDLADSRNWLCDPTFVSEVKALVARWNISPVLPSAPLTVTDWDKVPGRNWSIEQLVTWVALHAYKAYDQVYNGFKNGYSFNLDSARKLTLLATAMSIHVLRKAGYGLGMPYHEIGATSRSSDKLDIFRAGGNRVYATGWEPGKTAWHDWEIVANGQAPSGSPVTVVSRAPDKVDLFVVGNDGGIYTAAWMPGDVTWRGWWLIANGHAPLGARISAIVRSTDKLDLFMAGNDGYVYTAAWQPETATWHAWGVIGTLRVPPGAPVHVVSRSPDKLDIFVTDVNGVIQTAAWEPGFTDGWHGWWPINNGRAVPGAPVTAVSRNTDKIDLFVVGTDGRVWTAAWEPSFTDGWHGWWPIGDCHVPAGTPVSVISRSPDKLDIFLTDKNGIIQTAAWEPSFLDGWHGWWPINNGRAVPGAPVTAVSRNTDKIDLFVTGTDGAVWTAAWEPSFPDGWHGWWSIRSAIL